jgi:hypothetical protein
MNLNIIKHDSPCYTTSVMHNYIKDNLDVVSVSTEYKENFKNLFLIECQSSLYDFFSFGLPNEIIDLIKQNKVKALICCIPEATWDFSKIETLTKKYCKENSIPIDSLLFLDSNILIKDCKEIKGFYVPHFLLDGGYMGRYIVEGNFKSKNELNYIPTLPTNEEAKNTLDRENYFISFNRSNHRRHRIILGCYFMEKNDDRILWSYLSKPEHMHGHDKTTKYQIKLMLDNMKKLREVVPKQLDTHFLKSLEGFGTSENYDKEKLSLNCYFDIVTETEFEDTDKIFFTEKILRPILNLHPFIVISSGGFLKHFKKFGFKTFDGLFDESYDDITNKWERLDFILKEIDNILSKPKEEVKELYKKYLDICIYNRDHLFNNLAPKKNGGEIYDLLKNEIMGELI